MTRTAILGLTIRTTARTSCRTASAAYTAYMMGNDLTTYSRGPEWPDHIFGTVRISGLTYFSSEDTHIDVLMTDFECYGFGFDAHAVAALLFLSSDFRSPR